MDRINKCIEFDKNVNEFYNYLLNVNSIKNLDCYDVNVSKNNFFKCKIKKLLIIEEDKEIYKVFSNVGAVEQEQLQKLVDQLGLRPVILPNETIYKGEYLTIIKQKKLKVASKELVEEQIKDLPERNKIIPYEGIGEDINIFFASTLNNELYNRLITFFQLLKQPDLLYRNFGFDENNNLLCFDIENFNPNFKINK